MVEKVAVKIRIPAGSTVVWKKNRNGDRKPVTVKRKSYLKTMYLKG